jgi:DNA-binding response OmpR family regulator
MNIALHLQDAAEMRRIASLLESGGARCQCQPSVEAALHAAHHGDYDVAVIDVRALRDHEALLAWIRGRAATTTALVMVISDVRSDSVVQMLEAGADDVVLAAVSPAVLVARVRAVHRRSRHASPDHDRLHLAGFVLDRNAGTVMDREREVALTPREFAMAWFLFTRPARFTSREAISQAVWGLQADIAEHTIEQHIYMLRKKLSLYPDRGVWIRAAYGRGYRLEVRTADAVAPVEGTLPSDVLAVAKVAETLWAPQGHQG